MMGKGAKRKSSPTDIISAADGQDGFQDVTFVETLDSRLQCSICHNALCRPRQTNCGHRFCEDCFRPYITTSSPSSLRCPVDEEKLDSKEIFFDRYCEREVLSLGCLCYNHTRGCQWQGELRTIEGHVQECPYSLIGCTSSGCTDKVQKRHLNDHVNNTCPHRLVTCELCTKRVKQAEKEEHLQYCPKAVVQCTLGCGTQVSRDTFNDHVTSQCPKAELSCLLSLSGCDFKGFKDELLEHTSKSTTKHIDILGKKSQEISGNITEMKERIIKLETENEHLGNQMKSQREVLASTKQDLTTQQIKTGILEKNISRSARELSELKETVERSLQNPSMNSKAVENQMEEILALVTRQEERVKGLERELAQKAIDNELGPNSLGYAANGMSTTRRLDRTDHQLAIHEIQLSEQDLKLQMLEATSYDGVYMWKINDWISRLNEAVTGKTPSVYSPPFYVGRFGYKVCARLYPNGDGIGKGTHLSLFFVVMRGEYDALLSWPFRQKVTFSLLDQDGYRNSTDSFLPNSNSSSFKRPTSAMNIASGSPQFLSHQNLQSRRYIKDDTMFVKITVDRTGMVDF